jgi:thiol-disulfide isomerase/thioredoxin
MPTLRMTQDSPSTAETLMRRRLLLAGASLLAPAWSAARTGPNGPAKSVSPRPTPMTAAEEAEVAKAVAEHVAYQTGEPAHPAVGLSPKLPGSIKLFDGHDFSEAQAKGKLLLIFYWASWCPICKVVAPRLNDFWLKNRARGVEVLALSTDTELHPAVNYIRHAGYKYPVAMATSAHLDQAFSPRSLPTLLVRSKLGVIVTAEEGDVDAGEFRDLLVHL